MQREELLNRVVSLVQAGGITRIIDDAYSIIGLRAPTVGEGLFSSHCRTDRTLALAGLRMDPKHLRYQQWKNALSNIPGVDFIRLGEILNAGLRKGRASRTSGSESEDGFPLITTADIRNGYARPGEVNIPNLSPDVAPGDLVIAVDGEGSAGKAGLVECESNGAVLDSHVAILQVDETVMDRRYVCAALNSTWCRAQADWLMRGSSGQMSLSEVDAVNIVIPVPSLDAQRLLADQALMIGMQPDRLKVTLDSWFGEVFGQ